MILISHRGNILGRNPDFENQPDYIDKTIKLGYDVEIDLRVINSELYLGHDNPQYKINQSFLDGRIGKLWIHCKNLDALTWISGKSYHYFWHENDTVTLTSQNYVWAFPGKQPLINSIAVMPEIFHDDISLSLGVCSDYIKNYK